MSEKTPFSVEEYEKLNPIQTVELDGRSIAFATPNRATLWRVQSLFTKEPATIAWLKAMPAGSRFLDVGANVGMYSIFAAKMRACSVFAFEPESQNYALLNRNIFLNQLSAQISAYCAALSDKAGMSTLYLSSFMPGGSCHSVAQDVDFNLQPRQSPFAQACIQTTVDHLVDSGVMAVPEFIKIDVDGFEHQVIQGASRTLRDPGVRSVLIEINPAIDEHLEIIGTLRGLGFAADPGQVRQSTRTSGPFEGVAEQIFWRTSPPGSSGLLPGNLSARAADHSREVCARIDAAEVRHAPFDHCIVDGVFPAALLQGIRQYWPEEEEFESIEDTGRVHVAEDQRGTRRVVLLNDRGFSRLSADRRAFWRDEMWAWLSGPQFREVLLGKFPDILVPRLVTGSRLGADALIVSDRTRYAIGPHTDSPRRLLSLLFYLPEDATLAEFGTSFYAPVQQGFVSAGGPHLRFEDFTRVRTVEFLPNRLLMFPKTDRCFHGVEPFSRRNAERRLLIFDLQLVQAPGGQHGRSAPGAIVAGESGSVISGVSFSRENPSKRYRELLQQYRQMHAEGERFLNVPPQGTFPGLSLLPHLAAIKELVDSSGSIDILDYGAGKGLQYRPQPIRIQGREGAWDSVAEYWEIDNVVCYDPCFPPFSTLPEGTFDGVISTDMLEHCPQEDLAWVLDEIFSFSRKFVFLTIAGYAARKRLPNGENAHSTIKPLRWWKDLVEETARKYPGIRWQVRYYGAGGPGEYVEFGSDDARA